MALILLLLQVVIDSNGFDFGCFYLLLRFIVMLDLSLIIIDTLICTIIMNQLRCRVLVVHDCFEVEQVLTGGFHVMERSLPFSILHCLTLIQIVIHW